MQEAKRLAVEARWAEEEWLQKAIEVAQKREDVFFQNYIDEKLKRHNDERLARKKRLEEISARTRGAKLTNSTLE